MLMNLFSLFVVQCYAIIEQTESQAVNYRINDLSNLLLKDSNHTTNFVISPVSIFSAFKVLQKATSGTAHDEIEAAFGHESFQEFQKSINYYNEKLYDIAMINRVFFKDLGTNVLEEDLKNITQAFDFKNMDQNPFIINRFIENKTNGKIRDAFAESFDPDTLFLIISTLFFKSSWTTWFYSSEICWRKDDTPCSVRHAFSGMDLFNSFYGTRRGQTFRIIELPLAMPNEQMEFKNTKLVFQIWLPNKVLVSKDDHRAFLDLMRSEMGSTIARDMRSARLDLTIPKLTISTELDLKKTFRQQGVVSIFKPGLHLGPIYGENDTRSVLGEAKHIVKFDVDEKGIEAAAVTALSIMSRTFATQIKIDRPFYFRLIIKTNNPTILKNGAEIFSGRVVDP